MTTKQTISTDRSLSNFLLNQDDQPLSERVEVFDQFLSALKSKGHYSYQRPLLSPTDREVIIYDQFSQKKKRMLMFASNNYLGLATHPYVKKKVEESINKYGVGMGGPPLLNGYSGQMQDLEEKISEFKGTQATIIFPAGFMANVGVIDALVKKKDIVIYDKLSHASFYTGLKLSDCAQIRFPHNNVDIMEKLIIEQKTMHPSVFVSMEGVYSMDGDKAPLDKMMPICKEHGAISLLDDAHGVGVLGKNGRGVSELLGVEDQVDVHIGTFSKVFSVAGGYLSGKKEIIDYIRYFAQPFVFSAALPPMVLAAVGAGVDIIQGEPERRERLLNNAIYAYQKLKAFGLVVSPAAAILAIKLPKNMDIRKANNLFHRLGIFINAIEYPAVGLNKERFRVSITANHTQDDINRLANCFDQVWNDPNCRN